jgi:4a-hydroxytetrahydrobiopterin dehydratase
MAIEEVTMNPLTSRSCEACRAGAPTATPEQIRELLPQIPSWRIVREQEIDRLVREFSFPDFAAALAFTNRVGAIAEAEGHHPALLTEWGRVTVRWWTHKIRGLHVNDFIMAAKTDELPRT